MNGSQLKATSATDEKARRDGGKAHLATFSTSRHINKKLKLGREVLRSELAEVVVVTC